jgi:hypothetical protein
MPGPWPEEFYRKVEDDGRDAEALVIATFVRDLPGIAAILNNCDREGLMAVLIGMVIWARIELRGAGCREDVVEMLRDYQRLGTDRRYCGTGWPGSAR